MKNALGFWQESKWQTCTLALAGLGVLAIARAAYRRMTSLDFKDKVVLITGGSRGLGLEIARIVARKGAKVVLCARSEEHLENAEGELRVAGAEVLALAADLSHPDEAPQVVQRVIDRCGRLDVLINNAGVMLVGPENVMEIADYQQVMDANFWSALLTPIARGASILNGIAPGALTTMMQWTDRFLPQSENSEVKKGSESESEATTGLIGSRTDRAAARNNEL